jgi:hypothetical protein
MVVAIRLAVCVGIPGVKFMLIESVLKLSEIVGAELPFNGAAKTSTETGGKISKETAVAKTVKTSQRVELKLKEFSNAIKNSFGLKN